MQQRFYQRRGTSSINSSLTYFAHRFWAMAGHRSRSTARSSAKYIQHVIPGQVLGSAGCTLGTLERGSSQPFEVVIVGAIYIALRAALSGVGRDHDACSWILCNHIFLPCYRGWSTYVGSEHTVPSNVPGPLTTFWIFLGEVNCSPNKLSTCQICGSNQKPKPFNILQASVSNQPDWPSVAEETATDAAGSPKSTAFSVGKLRAARAQWCVILCLV